MTSTLADHLRALSDDALAAFLAARPDLLTPPPTDVSALAARAQSRVSVARALDRLDRFTLEILDACRLTGTPEGSGPTSTNAVLALVDAGHAGPARAALDRLTDLAILYGPSSALHPVASLDEVCSPYPAGLGRPAARLDAGAGRLAGDPAGLRRALLAAAPAGRAVLDRLAAGPPIGTVAANAIADPQSTVGALVARNLLVAISDDTVELPREVASALRRDGLLGELHPRPPVRSGMTRPAKTIDSAGAGQVMDTVRYTEDLLAALAGEPVVALRTGGMGVRDLRRLAKIVGLAEHTAATLLEVASAAGLLGETDSGASSGGSTESRFLPTLGYDQWREASIAYRWVRLARAWLTMNRQPGLVSRRTAKPVSDRQITTRADKAVNDRPSAPKSGSERPVSALGPEVERTGAPRLRAAVLSVLAEDPVGATLSLDEVLAAVHWRAPRRSSWQPDGTDPAATEPVAWTLAEAAQLGLTGLGGLTRYGRLLLEEMTAAAVGDADDDPLGLTAAPGGTASAVIAALDRLLPVPVDHVVIQADLTIVVPGPPEPALATELASVADHESAGAGSVYRVTTDSVRRALDSGYSAGELHGLFTRRSRTGVPQALGYLIDDVARRHGGLRLGAAGCYLRSDDLALLVEIASDRRLADLQWRSIAPTVLVSPYLVARVVAALREAGYAPVQEDTLGTLVLARPRTLRAPPRRTPTSLPAFADAPRGLTPARLAAAVETVRRGDVAARAARRAPVAIRTANGRGTGTQEHIQAMAVLQQAIRDKQRVWVGYVDAHGAAASRLLRPISIGAGYLRAEDERTEMLHTFALHRITAAVLDSSRDHRE